MNTKIIKRSLKLEDPIGYLFDFENYPEIKRVEMVHVVVKHELKLEVYLLDLKWKDIRFKYLISSMKSMC